MIGLLLFAATVIVFRDYRKLEQYRYVIVSISLLLLILPRVPGLGEQVNGAYLGIRIPGTSGFQPTEFSKVGLVIFLASYLRDTRQVMIQSSRRFLGITLPPLKYFGPVLVIWGMAMVILFLLSDIGSSLMFYGALLAMLYVATGRVSFVVVGLVAFALGAWFLGTHIPHVHARFEDWAHPFDPTHLQRACWAAIRSPMGCSRRPPAASSAWASASRSLHTVTGSALIPEPQTDMIYAIITSELGLFGAVGVLLTYLLFVYRGFKVAILARDSFSKLLAVGLSAVFALQVFVIVGGVTKAIPLTGVTLPFISYGGASIVANFVLLALLLLVSDRARRPLVRT